MAKVEFKIRRLRKSDVPDLVRNRYSYWNEVKTNLHLGLPFPLKKPKKRKITEGYRDLVKKVNKGSDIAVVAVVKNRVVGLCEIGAVWPESEVEHVGTLGMAVIKGYRDLGIGRALLEECLKRAKKKFRLITTEVYEDNTVSLALIKKFGFKLVGKTPKYRKRKGKYTGLYTSYLLLE